MTDSDVEIKSTKLLSDIFRSIAMHENDDDDDDDDGGGKDGNCNAPLKGEVCDVPTSSTVLSFMASGS